MNSSVFASEAPYRSSGSRRGEAKQSPRPGGDEIASAAAGGLAKTTARAEVGGLSSFSLLTRQELLDHARHPRNRGVLGGADVVQEEANPLCGDMVTLYVVFARERSDRSNPPASDEIAAPRSCGARNGVRIGPVAFTGSGCIISQAAASMLTEAVRGKTVEQVLHMERGDVEALLGGPLSPSRVTCGMLALMALKHAIQSLRATSGSEVIPAS